MKAYIILIALLLFGHFSYSQPSFPTDKDFKNYSDPFLNYAGIKSPGLNNTIFELRFWIINYADTTQKLFIFSYGKNKVWNLQRISFNTRNWHFFSNLLLVNEQLGQEWDSRWDSLKINNLLSLKGENIAKKKWKSSSGIIPIIADGLNYRIELLSKTAKRRYSYSNPEEKIKFYDLSNESLLLFNNMISILNNELKFKE